MIKTINEYEFTQDLLNDEYANWSYDGTKALFDYLTELEEDTGEQIEFNRVALRCDFSEYDNLEDILSQYDGINTLEDLQDNTTVIEVQKYDLTITGYIIQNF
tara:strand:- start:254 stop:562 length:309 start_codon:yes stop_codon:yes gene_type:complete